MRSSGTASAQSCSQTTATSRPGPQLHRLHAALSGGAGSSRAQGARRLILDGEIVAFDNEGRPSQAAPVAHASRLGLGREAAHAWHARHVRDLRPPYLDGRLTLPLAHREDRRALLEELELEGPAWRTPAHHRGEGGALPKATRRHGIEGVLASGSTLLRAGRRASHWIKVKNV